MSIPTVSPDGKTWNLHRAGADEIPFTVTDTDISAANLIWKVNGGPTVTLVPDIRYPTGLVLRFTTETLAALPTRPADFYIKDTDTGVVLYDGVVSVRGFV